VLGSLEVFVEGEPVELGGPRARQRALLGYLLVHAGEVVPVDRLIDSLWNSAAPHVAAGKLLGGASASAGRERDGSCRRIAASEAPAASGRREWR
jgi:hypothetical protein